MDTNGILRLGIDIGSTTAKAVAMDSANTIVFSDYQRHNTEVIDTLLRILSKAKKALGNLPVSSAITGTAGMGISEITNMLFFQEVVSSAEVVKKLFPQTRTLIDLGGEDAKIIFFNQDMKPDIRMNGNCAGGTGAFIDQMASLLNCSVSDLDELAAQSTSVYPIASRCGVFAKTDVQNLISRDIPVEDIAASIFRAVAFQTVSALARGFRIRPKLIFAGGPLTFLPQLRRAFLNLLEMEDSSVTNTEKPELFPAIGAAVTDDPDRGESTLGELIHLISSRGGQVNISSDRLEPLFTAEGEFEEWDREKNRHRVEEMPLEELDGKNAFIGIDSGSTTTKAALVDEKGRIALRWYNTNDGNPISAVSRGLHYFREELNRRKVRVRIARTSVTGYGEDLIRFAFRMDEGLVETIAHFRAAQFFDPQVSFILDIGGQDMKAIFIKDRVIHNLELNESCSSGAGSFIQTFAQSLGYEVSEFARIAVKSEAPCDLGTRCTVFMNSKVKQALREGATIADISAGLALSVIKNCFNKVLKITDTDVLGDHLVAQGGTFKNPAVLKALEVITGKEVVRPNISEMMGAYGAALTAIENWRESSRESSFLGLDSIDEAKNYTRKTLHCGGCENQCIVTRLTFSGGERFYTGNKCEKIFTNKLRSHRKGFNFHEFKEQLIFNRPYLLPEEDLDRQGLSPGGRGRIGIPRVLNMYDNFPFWAALMSECGFAVVPSPQSTMPLAEKGYGSVMSENICFPAKLANGHIMALIEEGVDRILYPMVRYEQPEFDKAVNQYNCPIVTGYPQVIESSIDPEGEHGVPFDNFPVAFKDKELLRNACRSYLTGLGVPEEVFSISFEKAMEAHRTYRRQVKEKARELIDAARDEDRLLIMAVGRPYHTDPLINHKIPDMISALGVDLITEDALPYEEMSDLPHVQVLTQWAYPNRLFDAAIWAGEQENVEVVQFNSFGCGPDAITVDEVRGILNQFGKNPTVIKVDEITSPGSVKLRIRSMIESLKMRGRGFQGTRKERRDTAPFLLSDKKKKIIAPSVSPFYSQFLVAGFRKAGYDIDILPEGNRETINLGLAYANNDICYPATIVIGDIIHALQSGQYDRENTAVAITQTGGQCRASSYLSLLKKALVNAGYDDIPVVSVSTSSAVNPINYQPGFQINRNAFNIYAFFGILLADVLSKLYHYTAVREINRGEAWALTQKYIDKGARQIGMRSIWSSFRLMREAVREFNQIEIKDGSYPRVGIVGEIFVKYSPVGNNHIVDWLMERGIEVEVPPILDFFLQDFITSSYNTERNIEKWSEGQLKAMGIGESVINHYVGKANKIMEDFKGNITPIHTIRHVSENSKKILSLINQFGESWLLAGEIGIFDEESIHDVVCLQPFGCIANHVIAKGVEKKLKKTYPHLNLLFLDMDAGSSEVNSANRLEFLVKGARESLRMQETQAPS